MCSRINKLCLVFIWWPEKKKEKMRIVKMFMLFINWQNMTLNQNPYNKDTMYIIKTYKNSDTWIQGSYIFSRTKFHDFSMTFSMTKVNISRTIKMTFFVNIFFCNILYYNHSTNVIQYIYVLIKHIHDFALENRMNCPRLFDKCTICHILTLNASTEGASAIFKGIQNVIFTLCGFPSNSHSHKWTNCQSHTAGLYLNRN